MMEGRSGVGNICAFLEKASCDKNPPRQMGTLERGVPCPLVGRVGGQDVDTTKVPTSSTDTPSLWTFIYNT